MDDEPDDSFPILEPLWDGVWHAPRVLRPLGLRLDVRMTVIRLRDGGLFLHSPVKLDDETRNALDALGTVRFVVAPNRMHHLFLGSYGDAFPDARVFAAPGLADKRPDLRFHGILDDAAAPEWHEEIDQRLVHGVPTLNEAVFFHRATRTLLLTDLAFNVAADVPAWTAIVMRLNGALGRFGPTRLFRLLVRDRSALRASIDRILEWPIERITVTHGAVIPAGGRESFRRAFEWV